EATRREVLRHLVRHQTNDAKALQRGTDRRIVAGDGQSRSHPAGEPSLAVEEAPFPRWRYRGGRDDRVPREVAGCDRRAVLSQIPGGAAHDPAPECGWT